LKTIFENLAGSDEQAFYQDLGWLRADARAELYSAGLMRQLQGFTPREVVNAFYGRNDATDALGRSQFTDIHLYMTDDVLVKVDRMSMAHSLEVRSPLLDHRILEFAARLPSALKMDGQTGKLPLRTLAAPACASAERAEARLLHSCREMAARGASADGGRPALRLPRPALDVPRTARHRADVARASFRCARSPRARLGAHDVRALGAGRRVAAPGAIRCRRLSGKVDRT
jgi:hypothetical protein